jgi:heterodisulfide reductase subunit A-like polyferredoxin
MGYGFSEVYEKRGSTLLQRFSSLLKLPAAMVSHAQEQFDILHEPVAVIGSGIAGLITAHILLQDGFVNVEVLTRDKSVGGVWSEERVYPGLHINRSHLPHDSSTPHP